MLTASAVLIATLLAPAAARAAGGDPEEARAYFDKATTAFALGHYPDAAESFEKAFEAKPDSALLYNAAQAHRLAGNKERALTLYQNYLRLYPKAPKRAEVEARVIELKKAIEHGRVVAMTPPATALPPGGSSGDGKAGAAFGGDAGPLLGASEKAHGSSTTSSSPAPLPSSSAGGTAVASRATAVASSAPGPAAVDLRPVAPAPPVAGAAIDARAAESQPLTRKPLFWAAVGGAVLVVVAVVLVVALSGDTDPAPSLGVVR